MKHLLFFIFLFLKVGISFAQSLQPIQRIEPSDDPKGIGNRVEIDGEWAIVNGYSSYGAYILHKEDNRWESFKKLTPPDSLNRGSYGYSCDISNGTIAISAPYLSVNGVSSIGSVYIYQKDEGGVNNWGLVKTLLPDSISAYTQGRGATFGWNVALDDGLLAVTKGQAYTDSVMAVALFNIDQGGVNNWGKVDQISITDDYDGKFYIQALAVDNNRIAIGDTGDQHDPQYPSIRGSVYVYDYVSSTGRWELTKKNPSPISGHTFFGWNLDLDGETLAVGASRVFSRGAVYVYSQNKDGANNWGYAQQLLNPSSDQYGDFGTDVAIAGDRMLIGNESGRSASGQTGTAHLYTKQNGSWLVSNEIIPNSPEFVRFASRVALSENDILIIDQGYNNFHGAVYLIDEAAHVEVGSSVCVGDPTTLTFHFPEGTGPYQVGLEEGNTLNVYDDLEDGDVMTITPDSTMLYQIAWAVDSNGDSLQTGLGKYVLVNSYPNGWMEVPTNGCVGDSVALKFRFEFPPGTSIITIAFTRFLVVYTDGVQDYQVILRNSNTVNHPFTGTTTFEIKSITNLAGCTRTEGFLSDPQTVLTSPLPTASFDVEDGKCKGERVYVNFTGNTTSNSTYHWDFGQAGYITSSDHYSFNYADAGTHLIQLTVENNYGCTDTAYRPAVVHPVPFVWTTVSEMCIGDTTQLRFSGNAVAGSKFNWTIDGEVYPESEERSHQIRFTSTGRKDFELRVTNPFGCEAYREQSFNISQNNIPGVRLLPYPSKKIVCVTHHVSYQGYKDGEPRPVEDGGLNKQLDISETGIYYVEVQNASTCTNYSQNVHVNDIVLGLFHHESKPQFKLWPNPMRDKLFLQIPEQVTTAIEIKLMDMAGKVYYSKHINHLQDQVLEISDIDHLVRGVYLVTLSSDESVWQSKLIVE